MEPTIAPFPKRRAPGKYGGRPVRREFFFTPRDAEKMPSESTAIRNNRLPDDPNKRNSWAWALLHAQSHDLWLVVPCGLDPDSRKRDVAIARAGVWRTGIRYGMEMVSEYNYPNLYVKVV